MIIVLAAVSRYIEDYYINGSDFTSCLLFYYYFNRVRETVDKLRLFLLVFRLITLFGLIGYVYSIRRFSVRL